MVVWAISDLHLPARQKPMDIFGPHWLNHFERIREDWRIKVGPEDVVLLPGDLSWAMHLEEAREHLAQIAELPGRKVILRGHHDSWWSGIGKVRGALRQDVHQPLKNHDGGDKTAKHAEINSELIKIYIALAHNAVHRFAVYDRGKKHGSRRDNRAQKRERKGGCVRR